MPVALGTEFGGNARFVCSRDGHSMDGTTPATTLSATIKMNANRAHETIHGDWPHSQEALIKFRFYFLTLILKDVEGDDDDSIYLLIKWRGEIFVTLMCLRSRRCSFRCVRVSTALTGNGKINGQRIYAAIAVKTLLHCYSFHIFFF